MRTAVWSDSLQIGHPRIDREHRQLIDLLGAIEDLVAGCAGPVQQPCDDFLRLLTSHCAYEEHLMGQLPPFYTARVAKHIRGHQSLMDSASALAGRLCAGACGDDDLTEWSRTVVKLMHDLLDDDAELIGCLIREGRLVLAPDMAADGCPADAGAAELPGG